MRWLLLLVLLTGAASAVEVTPGEYRHRLTVLADRLAAFDPRENLAHVAQGDMRLRHVTSSP